MDPGKFSFANDGVDPDSFRDLSAILITHPHFDHMDAASLKTILANNPAAVVLGNRQIKAQLADSGIAVDVFESGRREIANCPIEATGAQHAALLNAEPPANTAYVIDGRLLHPGDSFDGALDAHKGIEVLALPVMAPWTTELTVAAFAERIAPKSAFPIHDGYAKDFFLTSRYENYGKYFSTRGIEFIAMKEPGAALER